MIIESATILVVDDDPTNVLVLRRSLEKSGYDVLVANDGFAAVRIATEKLPDLILLDIMMPERDGLEVCKILKEQKSTEGIPVIFVTATSEGDRVLRAFSVGGCDYVTKPFRPEEILARVSVHVRLRQAEEELRQKNKQLEEMTDDLARSNEQLSELSRLDPLTKLLNRRTWEESMLTEHERFERHGSPYSIIMIDVDHFKSYNDTLGHQAGDVCLREIAQCISDACRQVDVVGRFGGEEFVVLAPDTNAQAAVKLAERLRKAIWNNALPHPSSSTASRVTVSLGIAESASGKWENVLKRADDSLYVAKRAGRNMVYGDHRGALKASMRAADEESKDRIDLGYAAINVLVVDADQANQQLCKVELEKAKYKVFQATTGKEVHDCIQQCDPDVVIMEASLPDAEGLTVVSDMKANPETQDIPVIMISKSGSSEDILAGLQAGADEYLVKPLRPTELSLRVRSMARLYRERADLLRSYHVRGQHTRVLTRLVDFCRIIATSHKLNDVLEETMAAVADITISRQIAVMLPDPNNKRLVVAQCMGIDEEFAETIIAPVGQPFAGQVFASGKSRMINTDDALESIGDIYDSGFFTEVPMLAVPLDAMSGPVGVLCVTDRIGREPYEPQDLEYVELIAKVAASSISDIYSRRSREQTSDSIMVALAKLAEHRDNDTGFHLDRVTHYCSMLATSLRDHAKYADQITDRFMHDLVRAVPLHDIGKVAVPDNILLHPGKLSSDQIEVMRTHATIGAKTIQLLIEQSPDVSFLEMAADIAHHHHEWWNGSGYPMGLEGTSTPLAARITAVADVYDALTTKRVYKEAMTHDKAVAIMREGSGTQFDPVILDAFMRCEQQFRQLAETMTDESDEGAKDVETADTSDGGSI